MSKLTLETARRIIDGAFEKAKDAGMLPMTVVVLDAGGHAVALMRQDESGILRAEIAGGKAYGALGFGVGTRELMKKNPLFMAGVAAASGGRMVAAPGGVLVRDPKTGDILGAVGISGDTGDNDEICAVAGVEAAGLKPDTGAK